MDFAKQSNARQRQVKFLTLDKKLKSQNLHDPAIILKTELMPSCLSAFAVLYSPFAEN